MKKAMSIHFSKSGTRHGMLLLLALLLMSMLPKNASAQLDLARLMAIDDGITVEDQSTGRYLWTESTKEGCMPGLMSTNPSGDDKTECTLTLQITSEKDFQLSFDYQFPADYNRYLVVAVDGFVVANEMAYGQKSFSLPIVAGKHQVSVSYCRNGDGGSNERYACIYNMKVSSTIDKPTEKRPMAVFNRTDKTMTFYYDTEMRAFGESVPVEVIQSIDEYTKQYWNRADWTDDVKAVVFDPSFKAYLPKSLRYWFDYFTKLTSVTGIENLNTSEATYLAGVFSHCSSLKFLDLSSLDTRKAENFNSIFDSCSSLESLNLSGLNTEASMNMGYMFYGCSSLKELDLSSFSTANVYNMIQMFNDCSSLQTIYVSDAFKTDAVTYSGDMFYGCTSLKGAMEYDSNCTDAAYANYATGYFTKGCLHTDDAGNPTWAETESHEATCVEGAYKVYTCALCQRTEKVYTSAPDPAAHSITKHEAAEPTCGADGNKEYYSCELCDKVWLDAELTQETASESEYKIKRTGHVLDENGDCTGCHLHVITLDGVTAEFHNIAETSWDILNDEENNLHGLENKFAKSGSLAMTLTSDKDFELSYSLRTDVGITLVADGKAYDMYEAPGTFKFKAGMRKFVILANGQPGRETQLYNIKAIVTKPVDPSESCGKIVYDKQTGVATLYPNDKAPEESGNLTVTSLPAFEEMPSSVWFNNCRDVKKVVIDESFKSVKPKSTLAWFAAFNNCKEFAGLENLDLSECATTAYMFLYCCYIDAFDLTTFNTAKVKDMSGMFMNCYGLETIYAGEGFSTASVEKSDGMFQECLRLKGAISFDYGKTNHECANYETGYFTKGCLHKDAAGNSTLVKTEDVAANCQTAAHAIYECSICHRTILADYTGEPDLTKHQIAQKLSAVEPTCDVPGQIAVYGCAFCEKAFTSEDGTQEVKSDNDILIAPLGHDFDADYTCHRCNKTDLRYKILNLNGVKAVIAATSSWKLTDESDAAKGLMSVNKGIHNSTSELQIWLSCEKQFKVDYGYKVSSESGFDYLEVSLDGGKQFMASGENEANKKHYLSAGTHLISFAYCKDASSSNGDDTAWLTSFSASTEITAEDKALRPAVVYNEDDRSLTWRAVSIDTELKPSDKVFDMDIDASISDPDDLPWSQYSGDIETVRVDESFSQFRPKSVTCWFALVNADKIEGLQYLNTSETVDFSYAFCVSAVETLDLSTFDTSKGVSFFGMFGECSALNELDLTSFDMSNAENTGYMFYQCVNLEKIFVNKHLDLSAVSDEDSEFMFTDCLFLEGGKAYDQYLTGATMASYHDGYLSTYYKVGDKRFALSGDMTVDNLVLEDGKPFMTHDAFTARKATLRRALQEDNAQNIGTVCLPYAVKATGDYTLYAVKSVGNADEPTNAKSADAAYSTLYLEKISGELPAGTPAIFKANAKEVEFSAADAAVVEEPADDETLARDGLMLRGAFTEYDVEPESYVYAGGEFVRASSLSADGTALTGAPLTACLAALPGFGLAADRLWMESDDKEISAVQLVETLSNGKAEIYDLNGTRLNGFQPGVNIIRHANGKTQKVVVR